MRKVLQCSHWQRKSFSLSTYASRFVSFLPEGVTLNGWFSMGSSLSKAIIWPAKRNIFLNMGFLLLKHWIMSSLLLSFSKFWWHSLNNPMKIFCQLEYILKDFWIVKRHAWIPCFDIIKKTTNYFLKNSIFHPAITKLLHNSVCNLFLFRNMKNKNGLIFMPPPDAEKLTLAPTFSLPVGLRGIIFEPVTLEFQPSNFFS